ncbi:GntR family transcriptional regulator [Phytoactinopolyspora halophila]|uniref:GntR family transcriptional regulator n=1 Tax=Phytoactinopolyspora halophila TaxID=1981511 RepID=UPI001313E901|nr:GntR family transcriptional regulator [Phytoactinopolyspora halophila]
MENKSAAAESLSLGSFVGNPRRTAHEFVRETLREGILRGDLEGGTRLVQADIAHELGVSTTPVREALRDLATEGLVRLDAHRGAIVNKLTFDDLREIVELCRLVEPEAMRQVVEIADDDLVQRARSLAEQMQQETDSARWAELNRAFHAQLVEAIPSQRLRNLLRGLRDSAAPYVALALRHRGDDQFELANEQHGQILEALASGEADRCADLTRTHVDLTLRAIDESRHRFTADSSH